MSLDLNAKSAAHASVMLCIVGLVCACAPPFQRPAPYDDAVLRARAETASQDGIRVSATVPSVEETTAIFGVEPNEDGIEPVWLEIENQTERQIWFLPTGMDPEYFAPLEVAFGYHKQFSSDSHAVLDEHIDSLNFRNPIPAHSTVRGFVFTNEDQRAKVLNVDLVSRMWSKTFMLIVPIPGYEESARNLSRLSASQPDVERVEDESRLRALLEQLPCCTSNEKGEPGEPLNLVLIGELDELGPAFQRQNYRVAEVSPRYVFDRPQDLAGSKLARWVPAQPHQIRIWLTTICYQGKPVWVAQASTPLGGRFRTETREKPLAIEPEVDDARNDIVQDMVYSQSVMRIGYVDGAGRVVSSEPRTTPGGAIYQTDGLRAVLVFGQESVSLSEIEFFEWQRLIDHHREQMSAADGE